MVDKYSIWEDLKFEVSLIGLDLIPEDKRKTLIGCGNVEADILFVADSPDFYLDEDYQVAANSTGEFLFRLLDYEKINPAKYYLTTLTKRQVKFKVFFDQNRKKMIEILEMQIALIKPKIIVLLGKEPFNALCPELNFNDYRGQYFNWKAGIEILTSYEIETVINARKDEGKKSKIATNFWADLRSLSKKLEEIEQASKEDE